MDSTITPSAMTSTPDQYIAERLDQYQQWYDRKSVVTKSRYLRMRAFSVVGGGLVPVLINLPNDLVISGVSILKVVVTVISLLVVVMVSLESVFHYREQWKNYRSTEQMLGHEKFFFRNRVAHYRSMDDAEAFRTFVERIEGMIAAENTATLNVMTMASEPADGAKRLKQD